MIPFVRMQIRGGETLVSECDYDDVRPFSWQVKKTTTSNCYVQGRVNRMSYTLHRFILGLRHGDGIEADHINRNGLDNRRENLRLCSRMENNQNSVKPPRERKHLYRGLGQQKNGRFTAHIQEAGHFRHIGTFDTQEEAAQAYNEMAIQLHGEFAILNEIAGVLQS
jgi:hypothetical protein